jgi:hypothetical protein
MAAEQEGGLEPLRFRLNQIDPAIPRLVISEPAGDSTCLEITLVKAFRDLLENVL